jgi:hypothetical protein
LRTTATVMKMRTGNVLKKQLVIQKKPEKKQLRRHWV